MCPKRRPAPGAEVHIQAFSPTRVRGTGGKERLDSEREGVIARKRQSPDAGIPLGTGGGLI